MAKIVNVNLVSVPEVIFVNDDDNDFTVNVDIAFHALDISLQMEYVLHVFVYDIHDEVDAPLVVPNWDESHVLPISTSHGRDEYLGKSSTKIVALKKEKSVQVPMSLKLGKLSDRSSRTSKKLEVFATLTPVIGRASKWSAPFESQIVF
ncbi:MAG: hypothetical protein CSA39_01640 [Flavobacteriales bacterium]|nr:MAG: hypothetical protein CSA39_01640 [Flavobacteriales bacterium]